MVLTLFKNKLHVVISYIKPLGKLISGKCKKVAEFFYISNTDLECQFLNYEAVIEALQEYRYNFEHEPGHRNMDKHVQNYNDKLTNLQNEINDYLNSLKM